MKLQQDGQVQRPDRELDYIRSLNAKKGFVDTATPSSDTTQSPVNLPPVIPMSGSDSDTSNTNEEPVSLDAKTLKALLDKATERGKSDALAAIEPRIKDLESNIRSQDEALKQSQESCDQLQAQLDQTKKEKQTLANVFTQFGYSPPTEEDSRTQAYIAPMSMRGGISPGDAAREYSRILERDTPSVVVANPLKGTLTTQRDTRHLSRFIRENRDALRMGMEQLMQKEGFLRGNRIGSDASTTVADIPPAFLTYLSAVMRMEHSSQFILWQFPNRRVATGTAPEQTVLVPRVRHLQTANSSSAWKLTPGVRTTSERQPIKASGVKIEIGEYGMGKDANMAPVSIPDIILSGSLLDLENIVSQRIGYNYHTFEDLMILEMWLATSVVLYSKKGDVSTNPGSLVATDECQMSVNFLGSAYSYASSLRIPTFDDGCYGYAAPPNQVAQLNKDMQKQRRYLDSTSTEDVTNMLFRATQNDDLGRTSGYIGKIAGCHIWQGNSFSVGNAGSPGVQAENIAGSNRVTRTGFLFGPDSVAWVTALPMEMRRDDDTNFGRLNDFTWKSHEGVGALDVDPAIDPEQQLRVIELRTTDTEI